MLRCLYANPMQTYRAGLVFSLIPFDLCADMAIGVGPVSQDASVRGERVNVHGSNSSFVCDVVAVTSAIAVVTVIAAVIAIAVAIAAVIAGAIAAVIAVAIVTARASVWISMSTYQIKPSLPLPLHCQQ